MEGAAFLAETFSTGPVFARFSALLRGFCHQANLLRSMIESRRDYAVEIRDAVG